MAGEYMIPIYASLVINGVRKIESVPENLRDAVQLEIEKRKNEQAN